MLSTWDTQLLLTINVRLHHPTAMAWMSAWTWLGDYRVVLAATALGVWWGRRRELVAGGVGVALALAAAEALKQVVHRPRPADIVPGLFVAHPVGNPSFPSGHTTAAFALAAVLSLGWPRQRWWWWALAAGVAVSRMYLGLHYPSDCLAGALIGTSVVFGTVWMVRRAQQ